MKRFVLILLVLCIAQEAFAAKKDYKGLFGSYRRDKFTENEGRPSDWGIDLTLSTLLPVSPFVKSTEVRGGAADTLAYSTFLNVEASVFYTINYHWETYLNVGYYSYDTRKENSLTHDNPANQAFPIFHEFELKAIPVILGAKYRFGQDDIVPYIGAGVGMARVTRRGSYDNDLPGAKTDTDTNTVLAAQAMVGLEFFYNSRAGIRLEMAGMYMGLPSRTADYLNGTGLSSPGQTVIFEYQSNPIAVRYASGIFFLF